MPWRETPFPLAQGGGGVFLIIYFTGYKEFFKIVNFTISNVNFPVQNPKILWGKILNIAKFDDGSSQSDDCIERLQYVAANVWIFKFQIKNVSTTCRIAFFFRILTVLVQKFNLQKSAGNLAYCFLRVSGFSLRLSWRLQLLRNTNNLEQELDLKHSVLSTCSFWFLKVSTVVSFILLFCTKSFRNSRIIN